MFSLRFTIILLAILIVPCLIRLKYDLEPYPAVMLPSGARKVQVGSDKFEVSYSAIYAMKKDGNWNNVDVKSLFDPIPSHYHKYILSNEFGLRESQETSKLGKTHPILVKLNILKNRVATEQDKNEVKQWLRNKLREQNFSDDKLKIIKKEEIISIPDGENLSAKITDEKVIYLD